MTTYTVKGIPEDLYSQLKQRAGENHRSINGEFIACLQEALRGRRVDPDAMLARADAVRERLRVPPYTQGQLNKLKRRGRR